MKWSTQNRWLYLATVVTWCSTVYWLFEPSFWVAVCVFALFAICMKVHTDLEEQREQNEGGG
ncbi:MAG: hypothetical protein ACJAYR_002213 [Sneathiella sp.]|jgi:hypothetical protein